MKKIKLMSIITILSLSLLLSGCSELIGISALLGEENSAGLAVSDGTFYEEYACIEGSDGTVFSGEEMPMITLFDNRFEMRIITEDETQYVYGDYLLSEEENVIFLTLTVTQSEYQGTESEYVFIFNNEENYLITTDDIGLVTVDSFYIYYGSGYFEAPSNNGSNTPNSDSSSNDEQSDDDAHEDPSTEVESESDTSETSEASEASTPSQPTDGTTSPLPNDTEPIIEDLHEYVESSTEIINIFCPPPPTDNRDVTSMILQDWLDGVIMDEGMFETESNGTYIVTGYFWNDITQVRSHVDTLFGTASDEIYNAALNFFADNQIAGLSVGAQIIFGMDMFMTSGGDTERYFYDDGVSDAGVVFHYMGGVHNMISTDSARANSPDGTGAGYIGQLGEDVALVDLENNTISAYSTFTDDSGEHDVLTLLSLSSDASGYSSGQTEPVSLNYIGVTIITNETGVRIIGTLEGSSNLIPSMF